LNVMIMDRNKLVDFAKCYAAAWCSQDAASVAEFYSPEGYLVVNEGEPAVGREAIREVAQSFMTAFPDMKVFMDAIQVRGDRVEFHWTLTGTNTGAGGTGHRVRISGFESWKIGDDNLIGASQGHFDAKEYARQLQNGI
jgi:uncharacterized protein (TIGR02246 family)